MTLPKLNLFIKDSIHKLINSDYKYKKRLLNYLLYHQYLGKTQFEFEDIDSYEDYIKLNPLTTLRNERVKSYEELSIANFLTLNSIEYQYERKYIIDTADYEYGQYSPDFYLPEYDLWIEHFGIDRNGDVPPFFSDSGNKSAKESYNDGIKWKRMIHKENNTILIESFSYENSEGILLDNLKSNLKKHKVVFKPVDYTKVLNKFIDENNSFNQRIKRIVLHNN